MFFLFLPRPRGGLDARCISHKWVFDVKTSPNPEKVDRFKARLVARGDSQEKGLNYNDVYAPVIQFVSLRIILHLAAKLDLHWRPNAVLCPPNAYLLWVSDY